MENKESLSLVPNSSRYIYKIGLVVFFLVIVILSYNLGKMNAFSDISFKSITGNAIGLFNNNDSKFKVNSSLKNNQTLPKDKSTNKSINKLTNKSVSINSTPINQTLRKSKILSAKSKTKNQHVPTKLTSSDILISFRIDDITFDKSDKPILENALKLSHKYNITFDLAVIAKPFDERADPDTYQIYLDNKDVFEIVAHGYNHKSQVKSGKPLSEFGGVDSKAQETSIITMYDIFDRYHLEDYGTRIFLLPWNNGDKETLKLANKYGYRVFNNLTSQKTANISGGFEYPTSSIDFIYISSKEKNPKNYNKLLNDIISKNNQNRIQIIINASSFSKLNELEPIIKELVLNNPYKSQIVYSMISDRLYSDSSDLPKRRKY